MLIRILVQRNCCAPLNAVEGLRKELNYELEEGLIHLQVNVDAACDDASFELVCDQDGDLLYSGAQERKWPTPKLAAGLIRTHLKRTPHHLETAVHDDATAESSSSPSNSKSTSKRCIPCENDEHHTAEPLTEDQIQQFFDTLRKHQQQQQQREGGEGVDGSWKWRLTDERRRRLQFRWTAPSFAAAMEFIQLVGHVAEAEGHHPDIHLTGYNNVRLDVWTHAVDCLTETDFILATKISLLKFLETRDAGQLPAE